MLVSRMAVLMVVTMAGHWAERLDEIQVAPLGSLMVVTWVVESAY